MDTFTALADPTRRALVRRLSLGDARVVDLARDHDISRPAISRHLRVLTEAGLVKADDIGRERHYRLRPEGLDPVRAWLDDVAPPPRIPEHTMDALELEVRRVAHDRRQAAAALTQPTEETG